MVENSFAGIHLEKPVETKTEKFNKFKESCLVIDIETSSHYPEGGVIDILTNFEDYVKFAKVKWLGMYSYLLDEYTTINIVTANPELIQKYINQHKIIVGFNNEEFDTPIMYNNDLMPEDDMSIHEGSFKRYLQVDCLITLGASTFFRRDGLPFKNRGELMGYKFKKNSLKVIAETMGLETQKGDIDYKIFYKNKWTDEEEIEIKKYLKADVKATKEMFDKLWDFWMPFTDFISVKNIMNLSWIRSSIASLTYKAACNTLGVEETYGDKPENTKEKMGGRVIAPKYQEARKVWYVDFTSLYPHMFCQFNLFGEMENFTEEDFAEYGDSAPIWHGNELFKVKGYYDITEQDPLAIDVAEKLKERIRLKKQDPDNPMVYTLKIFLNSLYGAVRSPIFEQIHTENAGWDCCWLGQQIQEYTEKRMKDFGYETIAGDTDSIFVIAAPGTAFIPLSKDVNAEHNHVKSCLNKIIQEIKDNVPFPADTFNIDIEQYIDYIMWPFSMEPIKLEDGTNKKNEKGRLIKELKGKKKNYVYLYHDKHGEQQLKIVGLPIIKDNATVISPKILNETLKPMIFQKQSAKFPKKEMQEIINEWLSKSEAIKDLAREFKVKPAITYKKDSQIQAQISEGYFNGQAGVINLIKNKVCGQAGKTAKYATYEEVLQAGLEVHDLDLTKLTNELSAFVEIEE